MDKIYCAWCEHRIDSFYLKYDGKCFCEDNDYSCIKNYLLDKADKKIEEYRADGDVEYDMSKVDEEEDG